MGTKILHVYISVMVPDRPIVTNGHIHECYKKTYFLSQLLNLRPHVKAKIIANSMRTAWCHFRAPLTYFRSRDFRNVIFEKLP